MYLVASCGVAEWFLSAPVQFITEFHGIKVALYCYHRQC